MVCLCTALSYTTIRDTTDPGHSSYLIRVEATTSFFDGIVMAQTVQASSLPSSAWVVLALACHLWQSPN